jgi:hypothetical protein
MDNQILTVVLLHVQIVLKIALYLVLKIARYLILKIARYLILKIARYLILLFPTLMTACYDWHIVMWRSMSRNKSKQTRFTT